MNPKVQRYLPPGMVLGASLYFGWPPAQPLDLGDDVVRAASVRWDAKDLADPPSFVIQTDPFRQVLLAKVETVDEETIEELIPKGPDPKVIQAGLRLEGFANVGGQRWAVINGRPRLEGDMVPTLGNDVHLCRIVRVNQDHILVRCEETIAEIRLAPFGSSTQPNTDSTNISPVKHSPTDTQPDESASPPPPPQA